LSKLAVVWEVFLIKDKKCFSSKNFIIFDFDLKIKNERNCTLL